MPALNQFHRLGRRAFLRDGVLFLSALGSGSLLNRLPAAEDKAAVTFGMMTDLHYAEKKPAGSRHYRETLDKLTEAAGNLKQASPDFIVELGDFIDSADTVEKESQHLTTVNKLFTSICPNRHYVLGNHCVHTLTKPEFLKGVGKEQSYYSFDSGPIHFVVLDSCFRSDGTPYGRKNFEWTDPNIPAAELKWLADDLKKHRRPTIVFAHQRLDVSNHYGVKNAPAVRKILESGKQVRAVFQGHSHANDYKEINGIHYTTHVAMVEGSGEKNNAWSTVKVQPDGGIQLTGFLKQKNYAWE